MPTPVYDRYFDFKVFELLRDRLHSTVNSYRRDGETADDLYKHIFLAPEALSARRSFQLKGVVSPFVCLFSNSLFEYDDKFYSRSVLSRKFEYTDPATGVSVPLEGNLVDYKKTYIVYAQGYYQDFTQRVNRDLLEFDRLRYFDLDCSELCPTLKTRCEFKPAARTTKNDTDENTSARKFTLGVSYDFHVTFPILKDEMFIDRVEIWLERNKIYEFDLEGGASVGRVPSVS